MGVPTFNRHNENTVVGRQALEYEQHNMYRRILGAKSQVRGGGWLAARGGTRILTTHITRTHTTATTIRQGAGPFPARTFGPKKNETKRKW